MKFVVIRKKYIPLIIFLIIAIVLLSINFGGVSASSVYFGNSLRKVPIYCVETENKQVAISFDAAWGADKTEGIMQILKEYNCNATFFLVGFWVDKYSDIVKKIDENGFEIGTHSNTHPDMTKLSSENMKLELTNCINMIENITNKKVKLFRAPFGAYNDKLLDVASELNLKTIQWDVDSLDWKGISAKNITSRIVNKVKNGSIILCHNNSDNILDALPLTLDWLIKKGYKVTSIGDLIYQDNYTIDRNGVQHQSQN